MAASDVTKPLEVFGDPIDEKALGQIKNVLADDRAVAGALMADHHLGYSMPIGGVVAYKDAISPSGVGFDIGCGNKAVRLDVKRKELGDAKPWMRMIQKEVAFGLGRSSSMRVDHELFESETWVELGIHERQEVRDLREKAIGQLGTVGSGNHYVDLLEDDDGYVWIACHFGSRGLGHTLATWFLAIAQGGNIGDRVPEREEPAVLDIGTTAGDLYVEAMRLAGDYAYAGRDAVVAQVRALLGNPKVTFEVHNHHNYAWHEVDHADGTGHWVVRKGATPLTLEPAFIGGSMGDVSAIVRGIPDVGHEDGYVYGVLDVGALGSAPHGAGRVMSRTAAAGKQRKMWYCGNNRQCGFEPVRSEGNKPPAVDGKCPNCGLPLRKARMRDKSTAAVDWDRVREELSGRGIVVLGSGADEAPEVYKSLEAVLGQHRNIAVMHTLMPFGVVMAGSDIFDPYRD